MTDENMSQQEINSETLKLIEQKLTECNGRIIAVLIDEGDDHTGCIFGPGISLHDYAKAVRKVTEGISTGLDKMKKP